MAGGLTFEKLSRKRSNYINGNILTSVGGFKINHEPLRLDIPEKCEFPEVIEIKITSKCIYSCPGCIGGCNEEGTNVINPEVYSKLSDLPREPILFIISGGCIVENLEGLREITKYISKEFQDSEICVKINALDIERINNLGCTFGRNLKDVLWFNSDYHIISLNQSKYIDIKQVLSNIQFQDSIIWKLDHTIVPFDIVEDIFSSDIKNEVSFIIEGGNGMLDQKDRILNFIYQQRYHTRKPRLYFDEDALKQLDLLDYLEEKEKLTYSLGWNNYLYIDSVEGKYKRNRLSPGVSWEGLKILEYYDTLDK